MYQDGSRKQGNEVYSGSYDNVSGGIQNAGSISVYKYVNPMETETDESPPLTKVLQFDPHAMSPYPVASHDSSEMSTSLQNLRRRRDQVRD